jgi:hypothetical protein
MLSRILSIFLLSLVFFPGAVRNQAADTPRVDIPLDGDTVQGIVGISGSTAIEGFGSSEVFFGFSPNGEWFSLGEQNSPVSNQVIANWDTTSISDGIYRIRVVVHKTDGSYVETVVNNIHVQNYSNPEGNSSASSQTQAIPQAENVLHGKLTATPYPGNPAGVGSADLFRSIRGGALWAAGIFLGLGAYLGLRFINRRR